MCSGQEGAHQLEKIPGTPAGYPWDPGGTNRDLPAGVPAISFFVAKEKRTEKGIFAGCPRDTRPSRGFSEILCEFVLCACSAPYLCVCVCVFECDRSSMLFANGARRRMQANLIPPDGSERIEGKGTWAGYQPMKVHLCSSVQQHLLDDLEKDSIYIDRLALLLLARGHIETIV